MGSGASAIPNIENNENANYMSNDDIARMDAVHETCALPVVVAIDFGTSYSGYAFSFKGSRKIINTQTHGGKLPADRVPTVFLLDPDQKFNFFGDDAIEKFSGLSEEERREYFYFEHFKMFLYNNAHGKTSASRKTLELRAIKELGLRNVGELNQLPFEQRPEYLRNYANYLNEYTERAPPLQMFDISKKEIDTQLIFSLAVKYFKDLALETVDLSTLDLKEEYIQWMVERRARFTYGFSNQLFIPGKHPKKLRYIDDGDDMCTGVFQKMIEKNQVVKYGDMFTWEGYDTAEDPDRKHSERYTQLWRSNLSNPRYCLDNEGSDLLGIKNQACEEVGEIFMKPPPEGWPNYWPCVTQLIVGETELIAKHINMDTGEVCEANINFF